MDIPKIIILLREAYSMEELVGMEAILSLRMRLGSYWYLLSEDNTMMIIFEAIGSRKAQFHIYSMKKSRGKKLILFARECEEGILDLTDIKVFITFIKEDDTPAQRFARLLGLEKGMVVRDGYDSGVNEVVYSVTREDIMGGE